VSLECRITLVDASQPEKLEHILVHRLGLGEEVATVYDVDPVAAEEPS